MLPKKLTKIFTETIELNEKIIPRSNAYYDLQYKLCVHVRLSYPIYTKFSRQNRTNT